MRSTTDRTAPSLQSVTRAASLLLLLAGCYRIPAEVPDEPPAVVGTVTQPPMAGNRNRMLVEATPGSRSTGMFQVRVMPTTRVLRTAGGEVRGVPAASLVQGAAVEVWFEGPLREADPAQGTASTVHLPGGTAAEAGG